MNKNTKDLIATVLTLSVVGGLIALWILQPEPTVEELQAQAALETAEAEARALEIQAQALVDEMERGEAHKRRMEEEAMKTPEERVVEAEEQNSVDMGEAALGVVGIGAAAYLFGKMLDY